MGVHLAIRSQREHSSSVSSRLPILTSRVVHFAIGLLCVSTAHAAIFSDVPDGHWAQLEIEAMYHRQITVGCAVNPRQYCPTPSVTRAQLAAFVGRAARAPGWRPPSHTSIFNDLPATHGLKDWVMQTFNDGIITECVAPPGQRWFCPDAAVTRAEMAAILLRAKWGSGYAPPPAGPRIFSDVDPAAPVAAWIHELYRQGITSGCAASQYCPLSVVTRETMAVFLARTYQLLTTVPYYVITKAAGSGVPPQITAPWDSWTGYIATPAGVMQPPGTTAHYLKFEFETADYFASNNFGHFAIGIRGDGVSDANGDGVTDLRGRGILIGNVTEYGNPVNSNICGPTPAGYTNTTAIESFWASGNCVFRETHGTLLQNNRRYRVLISSRDVGWWAPAGLIQYTLWERTGTSWTQVADRSAYDSVNPSPSNLGGWFFAEVFSAHAWTMNLYNVQWGWY